MINNSNYISKRYNSTNSGVDYGFSTKSTEEIASKIPTGLLKCVAKCRTVKSISAFYRIAARRGITPDEVWQLASERLIEGGEG